MAEYRVKEKSFIQNALKEPGDIVELDIAYDKVAHSNLDPVKKAAAKGKGKAAADDAGDEGDDTSGGDAPGDLA